MKIPPRNLPLDADGHARWLEEQAVKKIGEDAQRDRLIASIMKQLGMTAGSATDTNTQVETNRTDIIELKGRAGLPPGGTPGQVVTPVRPDETREWRHLTHALSASYYVYLESGNASYEMTGGILDDGTSPVIEFDDDGRTMLPVDDEQQNTATYMGLSVYVTPTFDGEVFTVYLPTFDNVNGASGAHYSFMVENLGAFQAVVNIEDTELYYAGTGVPVRGSQSWTVEPGFVGAWHVLNTWTFGTSVLPATGSGGAVLDQWYLDNVATPTGPDLAELIRDVIGSTLVAGSGISITVNDGSNTILITNTGGGGPTSGYGAGAYGGLPDYGG